MKERPVGRTKDVGWQIGVSRTVPVDVNAAWDYLISPEGLRTWLGDGITTPLATGHSYETADGTTGEIRSVRFQDRIRLTWQPPDRPDDATVQIALRSSPTGCTFVFHTERLYSNAEREQMRSHWQGVADTIETNLADTETRRR